MNAEIRRKDRKIDDEESIELLQQGEYGVLSMCSVDNEGYGIPFSYVYEDGHLYFHCAGEGTKLESLKKNNKVSFCVVGNTEVLPSKFGTLYKSVIVFGRIGEIEGEEKRRALQLFLEKYSSEHMEKGMVYLEKLFDKARVLKLPVEVLSGKARKH